MYHDFFSGADVLRASVYSAGSIFSKLLLDYFKPGDKKFSSACLRENRERERVLGSIQDAENET